VIAGHGWYPTRLRHGVPWMPVAAAGFLGLLLALCRIPVMTRALTDTSNRRPEMKAAAATPHPHALDAPGNSSGTPAPDSQPVSETPGAPICYMRARRIADHYWQSTEWNVLGPDLSAAAHYRYRASSPERREVSPLIGSRCRVGLLVG
jgi:hypothetical protein